MMTCFDIGGSAIKAAVVQQPDSVIPGRTLPTPLNDFDTFVDTLRELLAESPASARDLISISICGVIDPATEIIKCANIPCIDQRRLASELSASLHCKVLVANDADCFTLAEAVDGAGRGHRVVFGAILGTGVGGALVIDQRLLVGAGGYAGEWGHAPITSTLAGTPPVAIPRFPCGCGQLGCLDTLGGARGLEQLHKHLHGSMLTSKQITAQWLEQDLEARKTIDCYIDLVADPLALVVNVVGASLVCVGGGLSKVSPLIGQLDRAVRARILRKTYAPLVVPSQCIVEPGLIGARTLGLQTLSQ